MMTDRLSRVKHEILKAFDDGDYNYALDNIVSLSKHFPKNLLVDIINKHREQIIDWTEENIQANALLLVTKLYKLIDELDVDFPEIGNLIHKHKSAFIKSMLLDMKENMPFSALEKTKTLQHFDWPELAVIKQSAAHVITKNPEDYLNEGKSVQAKVNDFKEFLLFCKKHLGLQRLPKIHWYSHSDNVGNEQPTFGAFQNDTQTISIVITNRHPLDIMRTLAHELCHYRQLLKQQLDNASGETGSPQENEANAEAGVIMRKWGKLHPDMFNDHPVENLNEGWSSRIYRNTWLEPFVDAVRSNNKREAAAELQQLIRGEEWNIERIIDCLQEYNDKIDVPAVLDQQKAVLLKSILIIIKKMDEDEWPEKWELVQRAIEALKAEGIRWPELMPIEKSLKSDKIITESESFDELKEIILRWLDEHTYNGVEEALKWAREYEIDGGNLSNLGRDIMPALERDKKVIESFLDKCAILLQLSSLDSYVSLLHALGVNWAGLEVPDILDRNKDSVMRQILTDIKITQHVDLHSILYTKSFGADWPELDVLERSARSERNVKESEAEVIADSENIAATLNTASEEKQIQVVSRAGGAIQYIKNPSEAVQLAAVKGDGLIIHFIANPTKEVQIAAIKEDSRAIKYIKNPSEEVQLVAVQTNGWSIDYIQNPASKAVVLTAMLKMLKDDDFEQQGFGVGFYEKYKEMYPDWPEWDAIDKSMMAAGMLEETIAETSTPPAIPQEVDDFIETLNSDDVGKERIGEFVVHYEGFSEWCQQDAEERTQLPPDDPRHINSYDDIYKEIRKDFVGREGGSEPVADGFAGDELYPVYYCIFYKPQITESSLNHINQYHQDGGSLEGYVVDTDQPQLENYLTGQGASIALVKLLRQQYHRVAIIKSMWVDEEIRGGGIGSDMLKAAIGDAFAFNADAIVLVADMAETNAMPLDKWYESIGFKTIGDASGDPVMVLDKRLHESWSNKYKKSIDCQHPKGFSQRAHCAGRKARQAGKHTKSKAVVNENRDVDRIVDNLRHGHIEDALTNLTYAVFREAVSPYEQMIIDALNKRKKEILQFLLGVFKRTNIANVRYVVQPTVRALKMLKVDWPELDIIKKSLDAENDDELDESSIVMEGVTVFHSSPAKNIKSFRPFTHFGSEKAAADRIRFLIKQKKLSKDTPITVYKIDLNINKPAMIKDAAVQHDSTQYAFALNDAKIFSQEEMMRITANRADMPNGWDQVAYDKKEKENLLRLKKMLKAKGYDGLAYKNKHEDKGHVSYVILDPTQAHIVGKTVVKAEDLAAKRD